jgi:hypothetical protein
MKVKDLWMNKKEDSNKNMKVLKILQGERLNRQNHLQRIKLNKQNKKLNK